jgi:hypothetical protein
MNRTTAFLIGLFLAAATSLHADPLNFSLTTAPLIGNSGGPFSLDFAGLPVQRWERNQ